MTEQADRPRGRVLVGVDGSLASRRALAFAADEARRRDAELLVLSSFEVPDLSHLWPYAAGERSEGEFVRDAERNIRRVVTEELGDQPGVPTEVAATAQPAARALIDRSADADLLVVGSRGRGGFRGLVMGSVSMQCMLHAHCPVTVVHAEPAAARSAAADPAAATPGDRPSLNDPPGSTSPIR